MHNMLADMSMLSCFAYCLTGVLGNTCVSLHGKGGRSKQKESSTASISTSLDDAVFSVFLRVEGLKSTHFGGLDFFGNP